MSNIRLRTVRASLMGLALVSWGAASLIAQPPQAKSPTAPPPDAPKVSSYASTEDLVGQMDYYLGRIDEALAVPAEYDEAKTARIKKDANTLIILALNLGLHDQDNKYQKSASSVIAGAQELAKTTTHAAAAAQLAALKKTAADSASAVKPLKWEKVFSLGQVMKQVSTINPALKRGLQPARLKSQAKVTAGHATMLAAIGQAIIYDTHEVKNPADLPDWYKYSAEMRDAAAELSTSIKAGNQDNVNAALTRLNLSCDTCHKKFHQEEVK